MNNIHYLKSNFPVEVQITNTNLSPTGKLCIDTKPKNKITLSNYYF